PPPPAVLAPSPPSPDRDPGALDPAVAAQARIRARVADLAGAERAVYPDLEVMAGYDSMFDTPQHRFTLGIAVEIPLERAGRRATVARARAALAGASAELVAVSDTLAEDRARGRRDIDEAGAALA